MQRSLHRLTLSLRRFAQDTSGAQLVEFALVLPLMLLLFAVIVEGGRMMWSYQTVVSGVRDASRFLARVTDRNICDNPTTIGNFDGTLFTFVSTSNDGSSIFPSGVTVTGVTSSLDCSFTGAFRSGEAPIVTVEAEVEITFPFAGLFTLVGGSRATIDATVADQSRVYGS